MAKKDLRAQMDAARAAAAFIGAAQEKEQEAESAEATDVSASAEADSDGSVSPSDSEKADARPEADADAGRGGIEEFFTLEGTVDDPGVPTGALDPVVSPMSAAQEDAVRVSIPLDELPPDILPDDDLTVSSASRGASRSAAGTTAPASAAARGRGSRTAGRGASPSASTSTDPLAEKPKAVRAKRGRKKAQPVAQAPEGAVESGGSRMTAQVLVPMTAEQREHADLLAQVMKITRAEVMRQALDEYWDNHKAELQAAVAAYEELIRKLMS